MARDNKLNPNQYTAKQLKKKLDLYIEYHQEECEAKYKLHNSKEETEA